MSELAIKKYGQDLLNMTPKGVTYYCPNYSRLNQQYRVNFWSSLLSSLSYFESKHSSDVRYKEKLLDVQGHSVISRGLLQISKESANAYGCQIDSGEQLHDAKTNINCAVRILNHWVGKEDKVIAGRSAGFFQKSTWLGAARYWSPFRDRKKTSQMAANTRQLHYCKN